MVATNLDLNVLEGIWRVDGESDQDNMGFRVC
jgi:hypothetical protein